MEGPRFVRMLKLGKMPWIIPVFFLHFLILAQVASAGTSIWSQTPTPTILSDPDTAAVELGVKFRSQVDGYVTGIYFYKSSANTGTHVGNLWTSTGTLLASVTFTGETTSGWQFQAFPTPVAVAANTTYVASYHTNVGRYSANSAYFTSSGYDNYPLRALANGEDGGNGVYRYGATAFPNQTYNATNYWVDVNFETSLEPDTTPPTVSSVFPAGGATGVSTLTAVSATFSEAMNSATITSSTFTLSDASDTPVPAAVAYSTTTRVATLTPGSPLARSETYTATIHGGSGGVTDAAGNALETDFTWSFTTGSETSEIYSIWDDSAIPAISADSDTTPVELGLRFRSAVDGYVNGIFFYKSATNTGTHVGNLWTNTGDLLASVTFANETVSGWQYQALPAPVAITADTTYVVSYHAPAGRYSADVGYFAASGVDSWPLRALRDGEDGSNGVYRYGAASAFPNQTYNATNYWVDLAFQADLGPDTTPPTVTSVSPPAGAEGVIRGTPVTAAFSEAMNSATVNSSTFTLVDALGTPVSATVTYDSEMDVATLAPAAPLAASTTYTATVHGGTGGVTDEAGNALESDFTWSFTTTDQAGDTTPPDVIEFTLPSMAASLTVSILSFTATDDVGVTGYMVSESSTAPLPGAGGWSAAAPASYTFAAEGTKTLYAWAKDSAGNVSEGMSASVVITLQGVGPEPAGWYAGDMHVHRSCGESPIPISSMYDAMASQDLAVMSLLADMGNGEVQDPVLDLPRVKGTDDPVSTPGRIVHWDAEWHWDPTYFQYPHQALGGHLVALGLTEAHQIFEEYTFPIFEWAHQQNAVAGFAHMQYVGSGIPQTLDCCTPLEYPVEVALGAADFISEDVWANDSLMQAYYRLLNCGFRPGFAAGTDYPCAGVAEPGSFLTYVQVEGGELTYRRWIEGIADGRTVISRNGHNEFLNLTVNDIVVPGDEIHLEGGGSVQVAVDWTANLALAGTIELVRNGVVVASRQASVSQGAPATLTATVDFEKSGWLAARRMGDNGYLVHTAAIFVTVNNKPVRASVADAEFYIQWMDNLLQKTSPGGEWNSYFPTSLAEAQARYQSAKAVYQQVALEAQAAETPPTVTSVSPADGATDVDTGVAVSVTFSKAMDPSTLNTNTITLKDSSNNGVAGTVTYGASTYTAVFTPAGPLQGLAAYTARVIGGAGGVKDADGNALGSDYTWSFATAALPGDTTPPTVSYVVPSGGATAVHLGTTVSATFSEAMAAGTISTATFVLRNPSGTVVPASVDYNSSENVANLTPSSALEPSTNYTATVKGGVGGVADLAGNAMSADFVWTFSTAPADPYGQGPGGPILVLTDESNPFSVYYAEILLAEGFNAFALKDISTVSGSTLAAYDVIILANIGLTTAQVTMLTDWVNAGGNLIAMRPDKKLAGLLGLTDTGTTLSECYLLVNTSAGPGVGIVGETIQFHGTADRYTLAGAASLATLYSNATTATSNPAVTLRSAGTNGGQAAAFTFDLARSVVYTRQGNPAWAGQERDGIPPMRSDDLFYGPAVHDPQPNWVDLNKVAIPQADEQQRLLANMIISMNSDKMPLPRFWYFPDGLEATVIMTGDDHGNDGTAGRFDDYIQLSPPGCSVEDWDCIRSTSYIYPDPAGAMSNAEAAMYTEAGFEVGLHVNTNCDNYTDSSLQGYFTQQLNQWRAMYPSLPSPATHRVHCIAWSGYTIMPEVELLYGIRLDVNYYYWPASWVGDRPGFFTGSGMPMRFTTAQGEVIDVYQAATQMTDESGQSYPQTVNTLLDIAIGPEGFYGAFVANIHTDYSGAPESDAIVGAAMARGIPVISARQMLEWLDARNSSSIKSLNWNSGRLAFSVDAGEIARNLHVMVPVSAGQGVTSVKFNGTSIPYYQRVVKGLQYAAFPVVSGSYEVGFGQDSTAPVVTAVGPSDNDSGVSLNTEVTATFSEAMDPATIDQNRFQLRDSLYNPVAATVSYSTPQFTAVLTPGSPLRASERYTATLYGGAGGVKDLAGNSLAADFIWSFATVDQVAYSIWDDSYLPSILEDPDPIARDQGIELGVKFRSAVNGYITGLRFYKSSRNTGTHVGNLWTRTGTLLAGVVFTNETASGWQYQALAEPVAITANTTYVASYHSPVGGYSANSYYFSNSGFDNYPLRALADGEDGANGMYRYGPSAFPTQTYHGENYWVDVVFQESLGPDTTPPSVTMVLPSGGAADVPTGTIVTATFSESMDPATIDADTFFLQGPGGALVSGTVSYNSATRAASFTPSAALAEGVSFTATVIGGAYGVTDAAGNALEQDYTWSFTTAAGGTPLSYSIWDDTAVPALLADFDTSALELGLKFRSAVAGYIAGVRFYKGPNNTGTHVGNLWTSTGTRLATVTFANETSSGWQYQAFTTPVPISADTTYVVSYHAPVGRYSADVGYFAGSGAGNWPLWALADGESGGNGVYRYGASAFPNQTYNASNYWVDVVFEPLQ